MKVTLFFLIRLL